MEETSRKFLIPNEGRRVRDPHTHLLLSEKGEWKVMNTFWHRRLLDEDVREGAPPADTTSAAPAASPEADAQSTHQE